MVTQEATVHHHRDIVGTLTMAACCTLLATAPAIAADADTLSSEPPSRSLAPAASTTPRALLPRTVTVWNAGADSADEQYVLEVINRARANPTAEGVRLGIDITEGLSPSVAAYVGPRPPLALNSILLGTARAHSQDMWANNYFAHNDLSGNSPFTRMTNAGYAWQVASENIAAATSETPEQLEDLLMIDAGVSGRGHRVDLLDIHAPPYTREVGNGFFAGSPADASGFADFLTQDFGATAGSAPFVVGVVYNDLNHNGFYDVGEGIGGITVTIDQGAYSGITGAAGGYAFPATVSGTRTVTFTGSGLGGTVVKTVTIGTDNVKVDALTSEATATTTGTTTATTGTSTATTGTATGTSTGTTGSTVGSGSTTGTGSASGGGVTGAAPSGSSSGGCGMGSALVGLFAFCALRLRPRRQR
jgi:uncharacterized protein YkwD